MLLDPLPRKRAKVEGHYAEILYPKAMLAIMRNAMAGINQQLVNPERTMDDLLTKWLVAKKVDPKEYMAILVEAINECDCLDGLMVRLNVEVLLEPDRGDTITICSKRRFRLHGEIGNVTIDENGNVIKLDGASAAPEGTDLNNGQAYEQHRTTVIRKPTKGLNDHAKEFVSAALQKSGYQFIDERNSAYARLETVFRYSSPEQNIIARLAFLIAFQRLQQCGPPEAITALLPMKRLTKGTDRHGN